MGFINAVDTNHTNPLANFSLGQSGLTASRLVLVNLVNANRVSYVNDTTQMPDGCYKVTVTGNRNNNSGYLSMDAGTLYETHGYVFNSQLGSVYMTAFTKVFTIRVDKGIGQHIQYRATGDSLMFTFEWIGVL